MSRYAAFSFITRPLSAAVVALTLLGPEAEAQSRRPSPPIRVRMPGYLQTMSVDSVASEPFTVPASRSNTYKAARAVLLEYKVPVTTDDERFFVVGSGGYKIMRKFGRERLSKYLNCGYGISGNHADGWRVTMALFVWIEGTSDTESAVRVGLLAGAQDMDGASKDPVGCGTTGVLEAFLSDEIRKRTALLQTGGE